MLHKICINTLAQRSIAKRHLAPRPTRFLDACCTNDTRRIARLRYQSIAYPIDDTDLSSLQPVCVGHDRLLPNAPSPNPTAQRRWVYADFIPNINLGDAREQANGVGAALHAG